MKTQGKGMKWPVLAMITALAAGNAHSGDTQFAARVGKTWMRISAGNLARAESVRDGMLAMSFLLGHRWDNGAYVEAGTERGNELDLYNFDMQELEHHWLGGGWQFDLREKWTLTPKLGLSYSALESNRADFIDDGPTERLHDVVPFVELALDRRIRGHFGMGLYTRQYFEEWGSTRGWGVSFSWNW